MTMSSLAGCPLPEDSVLRDLFRLPQGVRKCLDSSFLPPGSFGPERPEVTTTIEATSWCRRHTEHAWRWAEGARAQSAPAGRSSRALLCPHLAQNRRAGVSYWPKPLGGSTCPWLGGSLPGLLPLPAAPSQRSVLSASGS